MTVWWAMQGLDSRVWRAVQGSQVRTNGVELVLQQREAQPEVLHHEVLHGAAPVVHVLCHVRRLPVARQNDRVQGTSLQFHIAR